MNHQHAMELLFYPPESSRERLRTFTEHLVASVIFEGALHGFRE